LIKINTLDDLEFINSKDKSGMLKQRTQGDCPTPFYFIDEFKKIIEVETGTKEDVVKRFLN